MIIELSAWWTTLAWWVGLGLISTIISILGVVKPARKLAIKHFKNEYGLSKDNFYMFTKKGSFLHYAVHSVISLLGGPIIGFFTTLSKDAAIKGYLNSIIESGKEDLNS